MAPGPRIIIHGGAGGLSRETLSPEQYAAYRTALLDILDKTRAFVSRRCREKQGPVDALDAATYAVQLLEDNALFNAGHGAVFTRDGINELEASVMVSRGRAKRAVGVMGLRRVRNPILLAKTILQRGDADLCGLGLDVPDAQGHSQLFGEAAEQLAEQYGLDLVDPAYFYTRRRWDEHVDGLHGKRTHLTQGTVGAVVLDEKGVLCVATSTGGLTNKLTGRVGDTPTIGAGFWAEEWTTAASSSVLCLPLSSPRVVVRSLAVSGTGNGDSFLRTCAARTVAAMARWKDDEDAAGAMRRIVGPGGELQRSAGRRWGRTGEGEGGMIGIESVVEHCKTTGRVLAASSRVLMDFNCGGMLRAWIDDGGVPRMSVWTNNGEDDCV